MIVKPTSIKCCFPYGKPIKSIKNKKRYFKLDFKSLAIEIDMTLYYWLWVVFGLLIRFRWCFYYWGDIPNSNLMSIFLKNSNESCDQFNIKINFILWFCLET
jgi:hypothetical protein